MTTMTCSTSEMSGGGGVGMDIRLDLVPKRQEDMEPFEILLSESQERMLALGLLPHSSVRRVITDMNTSRLISG